MRIPTFIFSRNQSEMLMQKYDLINRIQIKINSGKKLINSSDDPVLALNIKSVQDYISKLDSYKNNLVMGQNRAKLMESCVISAINGVQRASELFKNAQSDTASNSDRQNIAREIQGILNTIQNVANTQDADGSYIFSGTSSDTQAFSLINGVYQYSGSYDVTNINISPASSVLYNDCGQNIFGNMMLGNGVVVIHAGATANQGTVVTSAPTITNQSALTNESYTLSFVTNANSQTGYQLVGSVSGQIIPAPPQTTPSDAPEYISGMTLSFNGISFGMTGTPKPGDEFIIQPSSKQNIFQTLQQTINLLNQPITDEVSKAVMHQQLNELSASLQTASHFLSSCLSEIGYRGKALNEQEQTSDNTVMEQKAILNNMEAADQYELISDLTGAMTSLKLTQETYSKLHEFLDNLLQNVL